MTTFTSRNVPMVEGTDPADIAARVNPVAQLVHDRPGVSALTTTQRNALTGAELWDGRLILNTTLDRLQRYDLGTTTWVQIPDSADIGSLLTASTPATSPAAAGAVGVSVSAARADHVHPAPTWQPYTPTLTSGTVGTGVGALTGESVQIGKTIHFEIRWILGTGFVFTSNTVISTPTTRTAPSIYMNNVSVKYVDASVGYFEGTAIQWSTGISCYVIGTNGAATNVTATVPFTWVAGDEVVIAGTYESS